MPLSGETENDSFDCWFFINFFLLREFTWRQPHPRPGCLEHRVDGAGSQGWHANTEETSHTGASEGGKQGSGNGAAELNPLHGKRQYISYYLGISGTQEVFCKMLIPPASESPENLVKVQILGPEPDLLGQNLGVGSWALAFLTITLGELGYVKIGPKK